MCFKGDSKQMINLYIVYFVILSFIGYIYECTAMVLWTGKWDNRGFLFGPIIPIYGFAAMLGTIFLNYFYPNYTPLFIFVLAVFSSAILEYIVHWALEKIFHAHWWDYSKAPLNINGRISLFTSLGFGVAGLVVIYIINPFVFKILNAMSDVALNIIAIIFVALLSADITLSVSVISSFINTVTSFDDSINEIMDEFVNNHMSENLKLNDKFFNAVDKFDDVRKKLFNDRIDRAKKNNSIFYKRILNRIKGFEGTDSNVLNKTLNELKDEDKHE